MNAKVGFCGRRFTGPYNAPFHFTVSVRDRDSDVQVGIGVEGF